MQLILKTHMNRQEAREMLAIHKCPFYGCEAKECFGPECVKEFFDMYEQTEGYKFAEQNKEFFEECVKTAEKYEIKDSGNRTEFGTGAVRDIQDDKGRCDLLPLDVVADLYEQTPPSAVLYLIADFMESGDKESLAKALREFADMKEISISNMLLEVSMHYKQGAEKYGERNWEKGIPLHSYIDSGVRHFLKHIDGQTDERHDRAFVWNMLGAIWTMEHRPEMIDIPFEMLGGSNENKPL